MASTLAGTRSRTSRIAPSLSNRTVLVAVVAAATLAGFAAAGWDGAAGAPRTTDAELAQLLRMMAVLKLAIVAAVAWLVDWRLRQPASVRVAAAYLAAIGLMAVGPGLIWGLAHLALGAALLHGGIALLLVLACKDEDLHLRLRRR